MKIQNRCGKTYYYHQYKNTETGLYVKTYIDRKNEQLARRLAQKGYYAKVKPLIEKKLQALRHLLKRKMMKRLIMFMTCCSRRESSLWSRLE